MHSSQSSTCVAKITEVVNTVGKKQYVVRRSEVKVSKMSDKFYYVNFYKDMSKLFMTAAESSFVQYCTEMPIVWCHFLQKFLITTSIS